MTRVSLEENGGWRTCDLSSEVIAAATSAGLVESRLSRTGVEIAAASNKVGAVRWGDDEILVRPKTPLGSLLFLLGYARDPGFRPEDVDATPDDDLASAVAETFARLAERALARGVLQGYRTYDETAVTVRGRIRMSDQVSRGGRLLPLELSIDEYTIDIAENIVLRAALSALLTLPRLRDALRRRLVHLDGRLDGVERLRRGAPVPAVRRSRLNAHYAPALAFAMLILERRSPSSAAGESPLASFVVDMAGLFESFVTTALREALAPLSSGVTLAQYPATLDERGRQPVRPDIVHVRSGRPRIVADAKYKTGASRVEDLYQMHAYCTVLGLRDGWLISVGRGRSSYSVRGAAVELHIRRLDLAAAPERLLEEVSSLAAELVADRGHVTSENDHPLTP
ncbi:McrC family protein [Rathayibacter sp. ZW T2_19]|uniref:McrC family protein n=1 Tax=Rathayibacter rubneri TaxID=2950106 RepID=A0A9X2DXY7_9MICO|nr:McrC family protein [Rathayibacter rubneri]MCM6763232.1 McrC family protein [Rathayibacter rubneri]